MIGSMRLLWLRRCLRLDSIKLSVLSVSLARVTEEVCQKRKKVCEIHFPCGGKCVLRRIVRNKRELFIATLTCQEYLMNCRGLFYSIYSLEYFSYHISRVSLQMVGRSKHVVLLEEINYLFICIKNAWLVLTYD